MIRELLFRVFDAFVLDNTRREDAVRRRAILAKLQTLLGGRHNAIDRVAGEALGAPASLRYATLGGPSDAQPWTLIDVELPEQFPLAMALVRRDRPRRHGVDPSAVAELELELQLSDEAFSRTYQVVAAPAAVGRLLLEDQAFRSALDKLGTVEIATLRPSTTGKKVLRLSVHGWLEDLESARRTLDVAVGLVLRLPEAYARVEQASRPGRVGAAYRAAPDRDPESDAAAARADEVTRLEEALANVRR